MIGPSESEKQLCKAKDRWTVVEPEASQTSPSSKIAYTPKPSSKLKQAPPRGRQVTKQSQPKHLRNKTQPKKNQLPPAR
ncbi:hypothetical protein L195_g000355 [Trifolium pratense]|uniref:Uncharacterized protein n=1 Tax=Trifolium pratense TaxID=57577 RepID=A0A2K3NLP2_TRIPR|nr:hypothetical protein L195_g000355 [Trifolium pratense]